MLIFSTRAGGKDRVQISQKIARLDTDGRTCTGCDLFIPWAAWLEIEARYDEPLGTSYRECPDCDSTLSRPIAEDACVLCEAAAKSIARLADAVEDGVDTDGPYIDTCQAVAAILPTAGKLEVRIQWESAKRYVTTLLKQLKGEGGPGPASLRIEETKMLAVAALYAAEAKRVEAGR